jgi:hypothetical protein
MHKLILFLLLALPLAAQLEPRFGLLVGGGTTFNAGYRGAEVLLRGEAEYLRERWSLATVHTFTNAKKIEAATGWTWKGEAYLKFHRGPIYFGPGGSLTHLNSTRFARTDGYAAAIVGLKANPGIYFTYGSPDTSQYRAQNFAMTTEYIMPVNDRLSWKLLARSAVSNYRHPDRRIGRTWAGAVDVFAGVTF